MVKKIQVSMSNKSFYSLVVFGVLVLFGIGVYAYGSSNPAIHGHSIDELAPPAGCVGGQVLGWSGANWQCVDAGSGVAIEEGCPAGYESFTNQLGESCILIDDWSESGSMSGNLEGNLYSWAKPYSINTETRIYNGKRQVKITGCHVMGGDCTAGWSDSVTSCNAVYDDVRVWGCLVTITDRYKAKLDIRNLYGDSRGSPLITKTIGPGTVDTILKYSSLYNSGGVGVDVPKGEHKGGCVIERQSPGWNEKCISESWPGKCSAPVNERSSSVSCGCEDGYRVVRRLDLDYEGSYRTYYYDCVKN